MFWAYLPALLQGLLVTLEIFIIAFTGATLIGIAGSAAYLDRKAFPGLVVRIYTAVFRGVPELIVVLLIFLGSSVAVGWLLRAAGISKWYEPSAFWMGAFALALAFGAYMTEVFRAAFLAVPRGDIDAAYSLGMPRNRVYRRVVWPQMLRYALPGMSNIGLVMLKDTALLSIIGVNDLMRETKVAIGYTKQPFLYYFSAALMYLFLTLLALAAVRLIEKTVTRGWPVRERAGSAF